MNFTTRYLTFKALSIPTQWELTKTKRAYLKDHIECAICGYKKKLEVHHVQPVHVSPELSCDQTNFIVLCRDCHFTFGHFHNFRTYWNPNIKEFAKKINIQYNLDFDTLSF